MEHYLFEAATPERWFVLETAPSRFFTKLSGPNQLTTDSRIKPPWSKLMPWQRFGTLLQQRFADLGRRWIRVCSKRSSNQGLRFNHVDAVVI